MMDKRTRRIWLAVEVTGVVGLIGFGAFVPQKAFGAVALTVIAMSIIGAIAVGLMGSR